MLNTLVKIKSILLIAVLLIISVSCRSDGADDSEATPKYYLKANFNGQPISFQAISSYGYSSDGTGQMLSIDLQYTVTEEDGSPYPGVSLAIYPAYKEGSVFSTGSYTEEKDLIQFEYRKTQTDWSTAGKYLPKDFTINVTQFGNRRIKGTFKGTLQSDSGETIVVENGEFYGYGD